MKAVLPTNVYNAILLKWCKEGTPIKDPFLNSRNYKTNSDVGRLVYVFNLLYYAMYNEFLLTEPYCRISIDTTGMDDNPSKTIRVKLNFFSLEYIDASNPSHNVTPVNAESLSSLKGHGMPGEFKRFIPYTSKDKTVKVRFISEKEHGATVNSRCDVVMDYLYDTFKDYTDGQLIAMIHKNFDSSTLEYAEPIPLDIQKLNAERFINAKPKNET